MHGSGFTSEYHSTQTRIAKQFWWWLEVQPRVQITSVDPSEHSDKEIWGQARKAKSVSQDQIKFNDNNQDQPATSLVIIRQAHSDGKDPRLAQVGQGLNKCVWPGTVIPVT